jgi:hypothetical protein
MKQKHSVSIEVLKNETDHFLTWVETNKKGFIGREIENIRKILQRSLEIETFEEQLEFTKRDIRKWISDWWSPSIIGKTYERHHKHTPRAQVILQFPQLLTQYLDTLSRVDQYILIENGESILAEMRERVRKSIDLLELKNMNDEDEDETEKRKKKSRRSKPPRCDK